MKCLACDVILTDYEATRKYAESGKPVDLCNRCLRTIPDFPNTIERLDLLHEDTIEEETTETSDLLLSFETVD